MSLLELYSKPHQNARLSARRVGNELAQVIVVRAAKLILDDHRPLRRGLNSGQV